MGSVCLVNPAMPPKKPTPKKSPAVKIDAPRPTVSPIQASIRLNMPARRAKPGMRKTGAKSDRRAVVAAGTQTQGHLRPVSRR